MKQMVASLILGLGLAFSAQAGLIHSYDYQGNALDSVGGSHGQVSGAVLTQDRFGNNNGAYAFNGEAFIDSAIDYQRIKSIEIWAALGQQTDNGDMLFSLGDLNGRVGFGTNLWIQDGYPQTGVAWNTWDSASNLFQGERITEKVRDGQFHHFIVTNDQASNTTSLFLDGELVGIAQYRAITDNFFRVGAGRHDLRFAWDGVIDDVHLYDSLFTSNNAMQLFQTGSLEATPVPEPSSLAVMCLWLFGLFGFSHRRRA